MKDRADFYFSELRAGLQSRSILSPFPMTARPWQIVFLQSGAMRLEDLEIPNSHSSQHIEAPALAGWPDASRHAIQLLAGSSGVHIAVEETLLLSVLGTQPDSIELRDAVRRFALLPLSERPRETVQVRTALSAISDETEAAEIGHLVVIEAQLRCLIVYLWRHAYRTKELSHAQGPQIMLLQRFRQLVETHYRDRWRVQDYAAALSTTTDRLHSVSTQNLQKAPLELIHERSHREARALLMQTNMTLDQIAAYLSFKTTPQFSAFFRKMEGVPPGRFRASVSDERTNAAIPSESEFGDWP